jgi:hypothetical protein
MWNYNYGIAGARQIFHKNFFFLFYKENLPRKWKKKLYFEKFAGRLQQYQTKLKHE